MDAPEFRHRLVAILAADAVGYSRLMSIDDRKTVATLDAARDVFREEIAKAHGRVVDTAGDFVLAVFDAAVNAVHTALSIQSRLAVDARELAADDQMHFRIGVHLGDIIEKPDGSIYGDGVNIAARLQALAVAGGIVVSQSVRTAVMGRVPTGFENLGPVTVKNIAQPIQVFQLVESDGSRQPRFSLKKARTFIASPRGMAVTAVLLLAVTILAIGAMTRTVPLLPTRQPPAEAAATGFRPDAIAVLAFENLSGDPSKEFFSDGVSEELSNTLEVIPGLLVIARTSTIGFKAKSVSVPEIGKLLRVAYVVEGSVRASVDRARISVRLTRAIDGITLWTESYDRTLDDVIGVQTEIALVIAQKLRLQIDRARLDASRASNAQAQRLYFEAQQQIYEHTSAAYDKAESLLNQALALDPNYLQAKVRLVNVRWNRLHGAGDFFTFKNRNSTQMLGLIATIKDVLATAPELAEAYAEMGPLSLSNWQFAVADDNLRRALELNPNLANAWLYQAVAFEFEGRVGESIAALQHTMELDPLSPVRRLILADLLARVGRSKDALSQIDQAIVLRPGWRGATWLEAALLSRVGRDREANELVDQLIDSGAKNAIDDHAFQVMARSGGRPGRERIEAWLRGPGSETDGGVNPHLRQLNALLALQRPADALRVIEDETELTIEDVVEDLLYRPEWDPISDTPRFREILAKLQVTDAYQRARAWREANPPQR